MSPTHIVPADDRGIDEAIRVLAADGLVAYPTDTLYGVGCQALRPIALQRVFAAKIRPPDKPLPLLLADWDQLPPLVVEIPESARVLARTFWPGALTLVLWRSDRVPREATGGGDTVAVRVPDHPVPIALARGISAPIVGTSANLSGMSPARTAEEAYQQLAPEVDLILDGGPTPGGLPSTIVDLTVEPPVVRRRGVITVDQIERVLDRPVEKAWEL